MISAIVLAAGLSSRMGQFKPLLPFGKQTVIEHIVGTLRRSSLDEIIVVTGFKSELLEEKLSGCPIRLAHNPDFAGGEMLSSLQAGLRAAAPESQAILVALGDQPALKEQVVESVLAAHGQRSGKIIIPSYRMRRGHPLLIPRRFWAALSALDTSGTLRDFLRGHPDIFHVEVYTSAIIRDMDTIVDYHRELARFQDTARR